MKQLNLFEESSQSCAPRSVKSHYWKIFTDGAARNNPGPAGVGIVIFKDGKSVATLGYFVGSKTNNQAEYLALVIGLIRIKELMDPEDLLLVISDSELLVKQVKGIYKIKNPSLKTLFNAVSHLLKGINYDIGHVLRHENEQADKLANHGIDRKVRVPQDILKALDEYNISL